MLRGIDRTLELAGWFAAAMVVVILLFGPSVVAGDNAVDRGAEAAEEPPGAEGGGGGGAATVGGKEVFTSTCGGCHTLSAAGTSGASGPALDGLTLDAAAVEAIVREGRGGMPAFDGELPDTDIAAVARFVADAN